MYFVCWVFFKVSGVRKLQYCDNTNSFHMNLGNKPSAALRLWRNVHFHVNCFRYNFINKTHINTRWWVEIVPRIFPILLCTSRQELMWSPSLTHTSTNLGVRNRRCVLSDRSELISSSVSDFVFFADSWWKLTPNFSRVRRSPPSLSQCDDDDIRTGQRGCGEHYSLLSSLKRMKGRTCIILSSLFPLGAPADTLWSAVISVSLTCKMYTLGHVLL